MVGLVSEIRSDLIYEAKVGTRYIDICSTDSLSFPDNKVISLFTGAGGLDIGLEQAGFQTTLCLDIDPDCRETIRFNRPEWKIFDKAGSSNRAGNIKTISVEELLSLAELKKGEAAAVVGGAPCQPFSNIGKKNGKDDDKNGDLFLEFVRIVKGVNPKAFLFENVSGITQKRHFEVIDYMTTKLKNSGYIISHTILNAANYGVAQKRERFFLFGLRGDSQPAFPLPTHCKNAKEWNKFAKNLDRLPANTPFPWMTLKQVLQSIPKNSSRRPDFAVMNNSATVKERMRYVRPGENFKVLPLELRPDCWKNGKHQGHDTFGRLRLEEPSVTIRTAAYNPSKGRYIHPVEDRGLSTVGGFVPLVERSQH